MKRVLIFSLAYYPHVGGAEVAIKEITDRIAPEDIEFHMVTLRFAKSEPKEERIGNVQVHRVGFGGAYISKIFFVPLAALKAVSLHKKYRFHAAWAMMSYMVFPLTLMRMLGVQLPYVLNLQDGDPFEQVFKRWFILPVKPLLVYGFRHARIVQPLSNYLVIWARALGYKGPVEIIPNGASVHLFEGAAVPHEGVVLVSTSRLVHKNALDDVIRALPLLPATVRFVNYGFGPDKDKLTELARQLGVADRVELLPHPGVPQLPEYLHAADIFIRPSRTEGFGVSFIEAFAAGLPVIATQAGGIADFLFDAKRNLDKPTTGWAVDVNAPAQIAARVVEILGNPEAAARVINNARNLAVEKYDWDLIARQMKEQVFNFLFKN